MVDPTINDVLVVGHALVFPDQHNKRVGLHYPDGEEFLQVVVVSTEGGKFHIRYGRMEVLLTLQEAREAKARAQIYKKLLQAVQLF